MQLFAIVGLPGSGKSSVSAALAKKYGLKVVSTDVVVFKEVRNNPNHPVTQNYINTFKETYGRELDDIAEALKSADFIKKYGNDAFRDLEEQAILHAFETGVFDNAVIDLGGSSFLRPKVQEALKKHNVISIYIDLPDAQIVKNLVKDFNESVQSGVIKRSNYYALAKDAAERGENPKEALAAFNKTLRPVRSPAYEKAEIILNFDKNPSLNDVIDKVERPC